MDNQAKQIIEQAETDTSGRWISVIEATRLVEMALARFHVIGYWQGQFSDDGGATLYEVPQESAFGKTYPNYPLYRKL